MRQVYISEKSLSNKDEISNTISEHAQILKEIDNNVRMWVVERRCKNLWDVAINEGKVINPEDNSTIQPEDEVKHLVLVKNVNSKGEEILFGNTKEHFFDFFQTALNDISERYPSY